MQGSRVLLLGVWLGLVLLLADFVLAQERVLRMATTTSTDNTGLLDYLAPLFKKDTGIELQWLAVGTGKALKLGQNCDVDLLLVHAPSAEKAFVEAGFGINRREVMYNDFIIVGPSADPAGIKGLSAIEAFQKIAKRRVRFVSRGDYSGTHQKELSLWKEARVDPAKLDRAPWYFQTGQGMLATLNVALEKKAYILTDRGTFIRFQTMHKEVPSLMILVEGDPLLRNQYSVIEVNPRHCPRVKNDLARIFSNWITSSRGQKAIADFKLLGTQLFIPNAKP